MENVEEVEFLVGMELKGKAESDRRSHLCTSTGIAGEEASSSCQARSELSARISERRIRMQHDQIHESEGDHRVRRGLSLVKQLDECQRFAEKKNDENVLFELRKGD